MNKLIIWPNRLLLQDSLSVESKEEAEDITKKLMEVMIAYNGMGLAAIQIGIPKQVFIWKVDKKIGVAINPIVEIRHEDKAETLEHGEGCLSLPGVYIKKKRWDKITLKNYSFELDKWIDSSHEGLEALAIQHEYDHLEGRLIINDLGRVQQDIISRKLNKFMKNAERKAYQIKKITGKMPSTLFKYKDNQKLQEEDKQAESNELTTFDEEIVVTPEEINTLI